MVNEAKQKPPRRYEKMRDSGVAWIGMVPEHWQVQKAKRFVVIANGSDPKTEGNIPVYGSGATSFKTCGEYKIGPAVLVGRKGSINNPRYVEGLFWNVDTAFDVKSKNESAFLTKYYFYLSVCFDYNYYGSQTTVPSMTQESYNNMFLPYPPVSVQQCLVDYLGEKCRQIEQIVADIKASIEEYKAWKASIIYEAVTKGLDPHAEMKDSGVKWIGEMPGHWERTKISNCFTVIGSGTTPQSSDAAYYGGNISWLQSGDLNGGIVSETAKTLTQAALNQYSALRIYKAPYIAIAMYGASIANASIIELDSCTNQACCVLSTPKKDFDLEYVFYAILSAKNELLISARGGTQPNISQDIIKRLLFPIPPLSEQKNIVRKLNQLTRSIDNLIKEKLYLIGDLESYKKSLIYEVVTGKRRIC